MGPHLSSGLGAVVDAPQPIAPVPVGIVTLKNRTLPVAQLFIEHAREVEAFVGARMIGAMSPSGPQRRKTMSACMSAIRGKADDICSCEFQLGLPPRYTTYWFLKIDFAIMA